MKPEWLPQDEQGKLFQIVEECGEVIQTIAKAGRFGLEGDWDGMGNRLAIEKECDDVMRAVRRWRTHDSNLVAFAESELERIMPGYSNAEERDYMISVIEVFASYGHSGGSASVMIPMIQRLMTFTPLSPLTGEEDEWMVVDDNHDFILFQNKRCSTVFRNKYKDGRLDHCYDIDGDRVKNIQFPYDPGRREVKMPIYEVETQS